jgi:hypothetical protein
MSFIRTKIKNGKKYQYLVENYWDKEKKCSRQRVIQYLGVETGNKGNEKLIPPSHKMEEIERAIPVGKLALYYAAARDVGLQEVLEKHFPSKSFPFLVVYKVYNFIPTIQKLLVKLSIHQFSAKRHPFIWTILQQKAN